MTGYRVEYSKRATRELKKLDRYTRQMIYSWISKNLVGCEDPRRRGKGLTADRRGQWRYRIGDYRLICHINDNKLIILALSVGHRRKSMTIRHDVRCISPCRRSGFRTGYLHISGFLRCFRLSGENLFLQFLV